MSIPWRVELPWPLAPGGKLREASWVMEGPDARGLLLQVFRALAQCLLHLSSREKAVFWLFSPYFHHNFLQSGWHIWIELEQNGG